MIVVDIDNVSNTKAPFSNGEGGFRGIGRVQPHIQNNKKTAILHLQREI